METGQAGAGPAVHAGRAHDQRARGISKSLRPAAKSVTRLGRYPAAVARRVRRLPGRHDLARARLCQPQIDCLPAQGPETAQRDQGTGRSANRAA